MTLLIALNDITDPRRNQAKRYQVSNLIFYSVLAILSNADSYRKIHTFIATHLKLLKERFKLRWKKPPSYSTIRRAFLAVDPRELESIFRNFMRQFIDSDHRFIAIDGKTLRNSFDKFKDKEAIQILEVFLSAPNLIIAHEEFEADKTNEIPLAQSLIAELGLEDKIVTLDALHCQKKHLRRLESPITM